MADNSATLAAWALVIATIALLGVTGLGIWNAWREWTVSRRELMLDLKSEMFNEWSTLGKDFHWFWNPLRDAYVRFRVSRPSAQELLDNLIFASGPPVNLPTSHEINLIEWPLFNEKILGPDQLQLWQFASYVYPSKRGPDGNVLYYSNLAPEVKEFFHNQRRNMAHFWVRWLDRVGVESLGNPYTDQTAQVVMLTWLEVALQQATQNPGQGKVSLFNFANWLYQRHITGL